MFANNRRKCTRALLRRELTGLGELVKELVWEHRIDLWLGQYAVSLCRLMAALDRLLGRLCSSCGDRACVMCTLGMIESPLGLSSVCMVSGLLVALHVLFGPVSTTHVMGCTSSRRRADDSVVNPDLRPLSAKATKQGLACSSPCEQGSASTSSQAHPHGLPEVFTFLRFTLDASARVFSRSVSSWKATYLEISLLGTTLPLSSPWVREALRLLWNHRILGVLTRSILMGRWVIGTFC
ncbi:hypothetical protein FOZ63_011449 [Perkinsus olseni]|uniref:Uncharacterized protein n=1 Tax=Perkinsus olseni TaxID=32597 RepID=A0A7J6QN47_PEROL|nr:hypothetical protein FOZ63_011449 [Perkinsus olseni]